MKCSLISLLILFLFLLPALLSASENYSSSAVIKIFVKRQYRSCYTPWARGSVVSSSGTAFVLSDGRIITNAHIVKNATMVWLKRPDRARDFMARVLFVADECDLAILRATDADFLEGINGLEPGEMPDLNDTVTVIGYPTGGEKLSYTEGVISRLEYRKYVHDAHSWNFAFQTDAAINPGNSGGPVVNRGKVVGVAFQSASKLQNVGHFIPVSVLQHFLQDISDGVYDGFPEMGIDFEQLQNESLREHLRAEGDRGVLVCRVNRFSRTGDLIHPGDVLLSIDGSDIGIDGRIDSRWGRISFSFCIKKYQKGQTAEIELLRDGKVLTVSLKMLPIKPGLIKSKQYNTDFPYISIAGYVFQVLCLDFMETWGKDWQKEADVLLRSYFYNFEYMDDPREEIVVLSRRLPLPLNNEFDHVGNNIVSTVNGEPVLSFSHFRELIVRLISSGGDYLIIEFEDAARQSVIIPVEHIPESDRMAFEKYQVPVTEYE